MGSQNEKGGEGHLSFGVSVLPPFIARDGNSRTTTVLTQLLSDRTIMMYFAFLVATLLLGLSVLYQLLAPVTLIPAAVIYGLDKGKYRGYNRRFWLLRYALIAQAIAEIYYVIFGALAPQAIAGIHFEPWGIASYFWMVHAWVLFRSLPVLVLIIPHPRAELLLIALFLMIGVSVGGVFQVWLSAGWWFPAMIRAVAFTVPFSYYVISYGRGPLSSTINIRGYR